MVGGGGADGGYLPDECCPLSTDQGVVAMATVRCPMWGRRDADADRVADTNQMHIHIHILASALGPSSPPDPSGRDPKPLAI